MIKFRYGRGVTTSKESSGRITINFPYNPLKVEKIKTVSHHRWHPEEKHWSFPNTDGTLEKILKVFEGEKIHINPELQAKLHFLVIARHPELNKETTTFKETVPDLRTERGGIVESGLSPKYAGKWDRFKVYSRIIRPCRQQNN